MEKIKFLFASICIMVILFCSIDGCIHLQENTKRKYKPEENIRNVINQLNYKVKEVNCTRSNDRYDLCSAKTDTKDFIFRCYSKYSTDSNASECRLIEIK